MRDFIHLFETQNDFLDCISTQYKEPFVSYTVEENRVDYNQNSYTFSLFEKIFCNNVNEDDMRVFKNNVVRFYPSVYEMHQAYYGEIVFNAGELVCDVPSIELTEEQYNEISRMTDEERINALLPLLECQGMSNHHWYTPLPPQ